MTDAQEIMSLLGLEPLSPEGGYFRETYRAGACLPRHVLGAPYGGERSLSTAIYYLLTADCVSAMHRVPGDEVFHFYLGDPVRMLHLHPDGRTEEVTLGTDLGRGMRPQVVVPGGLWQGACLHEGGEFALLGTTMAPGFDYADYEHGDRESLESRYPDARDLIRKLTA